jgi:crooked neck
MAFMKFEERLGERENARKVMYRFLDCHPKLETYLRVAKYEMKLRNYSDARFIFEKTLHD